MKLKTCLFAGMVLFAVLCWSAGDGVTVRGVVTDPSGAEVPNAKVGLYAADRDWETRTDSAGRFALTGVQPGKYEFEFNGDGFLLHLVKDFQVGTTDPPFVSTQLELGSCPPYCPWYGGDWWAPNEIYEDTPGKPQLKGSIHGTCQSKVNIVGATVTLLKKVNDQPVAIAQTDERGEYRFADLEPGRYYLKISHPRYHESLVPNVRVRPGKVGLMPGGLQDNRTSVAIVMGCDDYIRKLGELADDHGAKR